MIDLGGLLAIRHVRDGGAEHGDLALRYLALFGEVNDFLGGARLVPEQD